MALTDFQLKAAGTEVKKSKKDVWLSDTTGKRLGWVLQFRALASGNASWYFRYSDASGKRRMHLLGTYPELGLADARSEACGLAKIYKNDRNLKAVLLEQEQAREENRRQLEQLRLDAEQKQKEASISTVGVLFDLYVAHLNSQGKINSSRSARGNFDRHASHLRNMPVSEIKKQHITDTLRKIVVAGKGRTAGVLRSYLSAAFNLALFAEDDASIPPDFLIFCHAGLERNPVAETKALTEFIKPRDRHLSEPEFRHLWRRLGECGMQGTALRTAIALGGQRISQLLRAKVQDINDDGILILYDPKGRRREARLHYLPLIGLAEKLVKDSIERAHLLNSPWLFSSNGDKPLCPDTLTHLIVDLSNVMLEKGEISSPFQMRDIRRTIETTLSSLNVSKDHRSQLQSHGISGVQARHYDWHDYLPAKKLALMKLTDWIEGKPN